jgi:two-component system, OmpR family, osmolarity sensor histidine kinase EnvZ
MPLSFSRLGFAGRLAAIILLALFAFVGLMIGISYVSREGRGAAEAVSTVPRQVAAIVHLLERTDASQHSDILKAVTSLAMSVRVDQAGPPLLANADRLPSIEWLIAQHLEGAPRTVSARFDSTRPAGRIARLLQFQASVAVPLTIWIALTTGSTAVFQLSGTPGYSLFGLPPGFWFGVVGALVGVAALAAIAMEAAPLKDLSQAVTGFADRADPITVRARGAPEIRALIEAVNDMQSRIAALLKGRTMLLGAISHDLKTYLTRLRLRVEAMPNDAIRVKAIRDLDDMTALIDDGLVIAKGSVVSERRERVDLQRTLVEVVADRPLAKLVSGGAVLGAIEGDSVGLRRLFSNVIDNAITYGERAEIKVAAGARGQIEITIDDRGPGIPLTERQAVFEPFYRLETSRARETGGSGLGLAIARHIVEAHGGSIEISDAPRGGGRVVLRLPESPVR